MMWHWDCSLSLKVDLADVLTFYSILFSEAFPIESHENTHNVSLFLLPHVLTKHYNWLLYFLFKKIGIVFLII